MDDTITFFDLRGFLSLQLIGMILALMHLSVNLL